MIVQAETRDIAVLAVEATVDAMFANGQSDPKVEGTVRGLLRAYAEYYSEHDSDWRAHEVESTFVLPILNPDSRKRSQSRSFSLAGKRDVLIYREDRPDLLYLMDHKTSSEDFTDPSCSFWQRLKLDTQPTTYLWSLWLQGTKAAGVVWDVIRKPGIKPKKLAKDVVSEIVGKQTYLGHAVSRSTFLDVANGVLQNENAELYGLRVYHEAITQPESWFKRDIVARDDSAILEHVQEQWNIAEEARRCQTKYGNKPWPKTGAPHACFTYNRPCEFLDLCTREDIPESSNWKARQSHRELGIDTSEHLPILTNSSMSDFRQCQRKFFYRHEIGIEKVGKDEEALHLGSLIHAGLEAYWNAKLMRLEVHDG